MQWQTSLPLIAILRGITPDEALAHVGAAVGKVGGVLAAGCAT